MNMHGIMLPADGDGSQMRSPSAGEAIAGFFHKYRIFSLVVLLPFSILAGYLYICASDQYLSEAHFLVRTSNQQQTPGIGLSQALSAATGVSSAQSDAMSIADYLTSHDVVDALNRNSALAERFQRSHIDWISRLHGTNPSPERLLRYFREQVSVKYDTETGITVVQVRGFTPEDSRTIAEQLLELGESRVNVLNDRSYHDSIATAQRQLAETETLLADTQQRFTQFRRSRSDIDPTAAGQAQLELVAKLTADLSNARAQLISMGRIINRSSPQYVSLSEKVRALEGQLAGQTARLTGGGNAIANDISGYEDLKMRQGFLTKRYESAAAALEKARDTAQRQQLYVVRVVQPNLPVKALYPQRGKIVLTALAAMLIVYALGWLIVAGMREHAA